MSFLKKLLKSSSAFVVLSTIGCGVKGDPMPPERPPELGRGRTTYKQVTEKLKIKPSQSEKEDADD